MGRSRRAGLVESVVLAVAMTPGLGAFGQVWGTDEPRSTDAAARAAAQPDWGMVGQVGFPQYPALSPDGALLAFSWAGDLWVVPVQGGFASRLTSHPAEERRAVFSPDGGVLAFESDRDGARNLYVMPLARAGDRVVGGAAVRVTTSDQAQTLTAFTADGKGLLFTSSKDPAIHRAGRMFRVDLLTDSAGGLAGGGPVVRITDAFGSYARPAGDRGFVFVRGNLGLDRPKYRGSGTSDVYAMGPDGRTFTRLTSDIANDTDPWARPDGSVVFVSSRDGQNNVWMLPRMEEGVEPVQLTTFAPLDGELTIGHGVRDLAVSADGGTAAFVVWNGLYTLDLKRPGMEARRVDVRAAADSAVVDYQRMSLDREVSEQALSPDGKTLAVVARGEVFVRSTQEGHPTRRVTETAGRERDLAWSPDGRLLYFASDDLGLAGVDGAGGTDAMGVYRLYAASVELAREDLAPAKKDEGRAAPAKAEDPAPVEPGPEPGKNEPPKVDPTGAPQDQPAPTEPPVQPAAAPTAEPAAAASEPTGEKPKADDEAPKKGSGKPKVDHGKRWAESLRFRIEAVTPPGSEDARMPLPSPDGKRLIYLRGRGDVVLRELQGERAGTERTLLSGWDSPEVIWAGDSRHIIYAVSDLDFNNDIWLMDTAEADALPVDTGEVGKEPAAEPQAAEGAPVRRREPVNLTRHPDTDFAPRLSADGKVLTFLSERSGDNGQYDVYQVYLDKALDAMTSYERDEYFKKAAEAAGKRKPLGADTGKGAKKGGEDEKASGDDKQADATKPLEFDAEDAYLRVRSLVSLPGAESTLAITPAADRIIFSGWVDTERALMSVDHKGGDRKTLQSGSVSRVDVSLTGDKVTFVRNGQVSSTSPKGGGKVETLPIDAPVVIDIAAQQRQKFLEAAGVVGREFYHPTLKGLDWTGLMRRYLDLAVKTRTNSEFNRVAQMLFGELDGSHLGIWGGGGFSASSPATGYLGVFAEPAPGGYRVTYVARGTPADAKPNRLKKGDLILAIDGRRLAADGASMPAIDLDAAMVGRAGKETLVEIRRAADGGSNDGGETRTLLIVPMSFREWDDAQYWDEVEMRREAVERLSGGRLGYLHIRAMGAASVRDFERDLYAAANGKEGLIIDVRDNGGGSTADILLSALTAPRHAWTAPRGANLDDVPRDAYPRDRRLIYAWTRPINVLINQNSFSNAEIFAHAIKTIGRGRLIGTATFGGVISTGSTSLIDGTTVRLPFRGWYLPDGTDMENNGAKPDIDVPQLPEDEVAGRDRQLEAAVEELLGRLQTR